MQNTIRWRSNRLDGSVVARCLGTPGQTKVSGDYQRKTTHEICGLAAKYNLIWTDFNLLGLSVPIAQYITDQIYHWQLVLWWFCYLISLIKNNKH